MEKKDHIATCPGEQRIGSWPQLREERKRTGGWRVLLRQSEEPAKVCPSGSDKSWKGRNQKRGKRDG